MADPSMTPDLERITGVRDDPFAQMTAGVRVARPDEYPRADPMKLPPELQKTLLAAQEEKARKSGANISEMERSLDTGRARMERAYQAEGVGPDSLPPAWNADQQAEKYSTSPIAKFGSLGSIFAVMASAFTHTPMINALNGSAAAMNAINAGDEDAYKKGYQAWKDNTALALQRHRMQHEQYEDAITLMKTDMAAGRAKAEAIATQYGDKVSLAWLQNGYDKDWMKLIEQRQETAMRIAALQPKVMEGSERASAYLEIRNARKDVDEATKSGDPMKLVEAQERLHTAQQKEQDINSAFRSSGTSSAAPLSDAVRKQLAEQLYRGDARALQGLGYGNLGAQHRAEVRQTMQELHPELSGSEIAERMSSFEGERAGQRVRGAAVERADANALTALTKQRAAISSFEKTALLNGRVLADLADKVDRTGSPVIERWLRAGRKDILGDTDVSAFNAQMTLYSAEVAKILTNPNMTGVLTDASRHEVQGFLSGASSAGQIRRVIKLLEGDFERRNKGIDEQIDRLRSNLGFKPLAGSQTGGDDPSHLSDDELKSKLGIQ